MENAGIVLVQNQHNIVINWCVIFHCVFFCI